MNFVVLGYTNPLHTNTSPLITIAKQANKFVAIFPDTSIYQIEEPFDLNTIESFIIEENKKTITKGEYSFQIKNGEIFTGIPEDILALILNQVWKIKKNNYVLSDLREYIKDDFNLLKLSKPLDYIVRDSIIDPKTHHRFLVTSRTKKNGEGALNFHIQLLTNTGYKTHYKKYLYSKEFTSELKNRGIVNQINKVSSFCRIKYPLIANLRDRVGKIFNRQYYL